MSRQHIQFLNLERLPVAGALVVPGRLDFHELLALEHLFRDRQITWLVEESAVLDPKTLGHLRTRENAVAFSAKDAAPEIVGQQLAERLANGGLLILVPSLVHTRPATPVHLTANVLRAVAAFGLPLLPVAVDRPRETRLIIERPSSLPRAIIAIGRLLSAPASAAMLRQTLLEAAEEAFSSRAFLRGSLARALLRGLKKHSGGMVFDGSDDLELPFSKILAAALVLAKEIRYLTTRPRVGIVLPPGKAGLIANLAVLFAGKTPVNLNFTASHEAIQSAMRQADLDRYLTADPFVRKVPSFPWPANRELIFIERLLPLLRKRISLWFVLAKLLPTPLLAAIHGISNKGGDAEAVLLFTSGSAGEPKGVPLSHRNVLANVCQFSSRIALPDGARILGCLPLFHSFGCTVTLWYPVIQGLDLVTYPSPVETKRLGELIAQHQVYLLLSTPTFLRGYMKRVDPDQLASLGLVVTGAEKLPVNLADAFEQRFGIRPQEGYGLTETSPATNVNLPDPEPGSDHHPVLPTARNGSVGQLLPGMAVRLTDPATDQEVPLDHLGIIWLRGANIFPGYLDNPQKSAEVLDNGWFRTGDVGRMDDDGFLYIEGRLSRFSKIAGEMVPHEVVEAAVNKFLGLDNEAERRIAVVGVPDEQRGEAIVLLSTVVGLSADQECIDLRYKLLDAGLPSLWCPKQIIPVNEIPVLASGKLDIKGCEALARRP